MTTTNRWSRRLLLVGAVLMAVSGVVGLIRCWSEHRPSFSTWLLLIGFVVLLIGRALGGGRRDCGCTQLQDDRAQMATSSLRQRVLYGLSAAMLLVAGVMGLVDHWGERGQAVPMYLLLIGFALLMAECGWSSAGGQQSVADAEGMLAERDRTT